MQWHRKVLNEIQKVQDAFAAADGGPSTSELQVRTLLDQLGWGAAGVMLGTGQPTAINSSLL
jgi:hypothetical protein